jgi:adenosine/AMP kinase
MARVNMIAPTNIEEYLAKGSGHSLIAVIKEAVPANVKLTIKAFFSEFRTA